MWPGNPADVTSLIAAIDRLQRRFRINRVSFVADRGMISAETIAELEACRLLSPETLADPGRQDGDRALAGGRRWSFRP